MRKKQKVAKILFWSGVGVFTAEQFLKGLLGVLGVIRLPMAFLHPYTLTIFAVVSVLLCSGIIIGGPNRIR